MVIKTGGKYDLRFTKHFISNIQKRNIDINKLKKTFKKFVDKNKSNLRKLENNNCEYAIVDYITGLTILLDVHSGQIHLISIFPAKSNQYFKNTHRIKTKKIVL